eukprot:604063-Pyramimonas_sp.AAC.1
MPNQCQNDPKSIPMQGQWGKSFVVGFNQKSFHGGLRMESFREGVQCEPFLWNASNGVLLVGRSTGIILRMEVLELASAMPAQCQR